MLVLIFSDTNVQLAPSSLLMVNKHRYNIVAWNNLNISQRRNLKVEHSKPYRYIFKYIFKNSKARFTF